MGFFFRKKKKILIVDDDAISLIVVETILDHKYIVLPTNSGKEAIDYLLQGNIPDLILLDIIMPEMDGWETFNRIKDLGLICNIPIAFLTSVHGKEEQERAREIGVADYIFKPFSSKELFKKVKRIIKKFPVIQGG